jgi:C1A family cysteine protease
MSKPVRHYGWSKPKEKPTELHKFAITRSQKLIRNMDLTPLMPPIYDQGELGSCTANALAAAYQYCELKEHEIHPFMPSRLFIYYNERAKEGTVTQDSGAQISDGINVIHTLGVCPEQPVAGIPSADVWPYDVTKFAEKPPQECYDLARKHHTGYYKPIAQSLPHIKQSIINGFPVVFGFQVYESFEGEQIAKDGILHMPGPNEQVVGGHAVVCVGFDDNMTIDGVSGAVKVRNSWNALWGRQGSFWMPYKYILDPNLCDDFWSVLYAADQ